jgi:uncharacterized protein (TIGR03437 family)
MRSLLAFAALVLASSLPGQADVVLKSAVNGASYQNAVLPNGKLAPGVLFIAFGSGMGPAAIARASTFPLPTTLSGTSIDVTVGGTTVHCIMLYATATQVAAVLPSNTPAGDGTMTLSYNGTASAPLNITVIAHDFGIFSVNQGGNGPGVFTDPVTNAANSLVNAANAGDLLDIWGSGLGAANGNDGAGPLPGDMTNLNVQAFVGGQQAEILYRGRSGCCSGIDQVRIKVPAVSGCYVPAYLVVEGVVSNFITLSVASSGRTCTDSGYTPEQLQTIGNAKAWRAGTVAVTRLVGKGAQGVENRTDNLSAGFVSIDPQTLLGQPGQPAINTCWVTQFPTATVAAPTYLDTGKITVSGPIGPYDLPALGGYAGLYNLAFYPGAPAIPGLIVDGTLLLPGTYTFTGAGGAKVGAFTASINHPLTFEWTNRGSITSVTRSQSLPITWTGATAGAFVTIHGQSPASVGVGAAFNCYVDATLGAFTVPASILSALPASYLERNRPTGSLSVVEVFPGPTSQVDGLDYFQTQFYDGYDLGSIAYQ